MRALRAGLLSLGLAFALISPSAAVEPDEILPDPKLEARAREISAGLRCLVCQNQSIDDSDAPLARDLRLLVRERLRQGASDAAVRDFLVQRYGEFVLLRPSLSWHTALLWTGPAVILLVGGLGVLAVRRRRPREEAAPLSDDEERKLSGILNASRTQGARQG